MQYVRHNWKRRSPKAMPKMQEGPSGRANLALRQMPSRGEGGNCKAPRDALHGSWNRPRSYPTILLRTPRISRPRIFETDFAARRGRTQGNRRLSSRPGIGPATPRTGGDQCRRNKASGRPAHGSAGLERTHSCWDLRYSRKRDGSDRPHFDSGQRLEVLGHGRSSPETILEFSEGGWNLHLEDPSVKGRREEIGKNRHRSNDGHSQTHQNARNPQRPHWTASDEGSGGKTRRVRPVHGTHGLPRRNEGQGQGVPRL